MEHSASLDLVRPWRRATIVATAVATVELVVLAGGALVLVGGIRDDVRHVATPKPKPAVTRVRQREAPAVAHLPRAQTTVLVLNGNGVQGAAGEAAQRLEVLGYRVGAATNAPRSNYPRSLVMFRQGFRGEAVRLARDLRIRLVGPLDGLRPPDLKGAQLALILGTS